MGYFNTVGVWIPDPYLSHEGRSIDDGAKIGSGRYRKGSGKRPNQHVGKTGAFVKNYSSATQMAKEVGEAYRAEREAIKGDKDAIEVLNRRTIRKLSTKLDSDGIAKATGIEKRVVDEHLNKSRNKVDRELEKELAYLAKTAEKSNNDMTDEDVDRYKKMQKKITDESVDWYDGIPKSERAKKLYAETNKKEEEIENTLGEKYRKQRDEWHKVENKIAWRGGIKFAKEKEMERSFKEIEKAYNHALRELRSDHDSKLVDVVLKDLHIPVNDENRRAIRDSYLLFWD